MSQRIRKILAVSLSVATGVAIVIAVILSSSKKSDNVNIFETNKTGKANVFNGLSYHFSSSLLSPRTFLMNFIQLFSVVEF